MGRYVIKKVLNILLYDTEQFYLKKQDGGWIKICEFISSKSLKEDLSIDTTFDPCYFLWDSTFKDAGKGQTLPILISTKFVLLVSTSTRSNSWWKNRKVGGARN